MRATNDNATNDNVTNDNVTNDNVTQNEDSSVEEKEDVVEVNPLSLEERRATAWKLHKYHREEFLFHLRKKMSEMTFTNKKQRSKYYSDSVVAYDKKNMKINF